MTHSPLTLAIAGSTERTALLAHTLHQAAGFDIAWVLTPSPKLVGRHQVLTTNPLQIWAESEHIPVVSVAKRLDAELKTELEQRSATKPIDLLLVVDFGYLVPQWLLDLPRIAPLNIHPSALPKWRGSSPGQFSLLYGDTQSAVTLMVMSAGLDEGPIIAQIPFSVEATWTSQDYYRSAFDLAAQNLPAWLESWIATGQSVTPQPISSPTTIARRLDKSDSYIEWPLLAQACGFKPTPANTDPELSSPLLADAVQDSGSLSLTLERACRALYPWPGLWTTLPKAGQPVRVKILNTHLIHHTLVLDLVQVEGKQPTAWENLKSWWQPAAADLK